MIRAVPPMVSIIPDTFRFIFFHSLTGPVSLKTVTHIVYTLGVNFQRGILLIAKTGYLFYNKDIGKFNCPYLLY